MDIRLSVWTDPNHKVPSKTGVELSTAGGGQWIAFPPAGQFASYILSYPSSPAPGTADHLELYVGGGSAKALRFKASNLQPQIVLSLGSLGPLAWDPREHFVGNIIHPIRKAAAPASTVSERCQVSCLNAGANEEKSGDGYCCVLCENKDIVVKVCC